MSNAMSRSKSRWKGALLATVAGAAVSPLAAKASMQVGVYLNPIGSAGPYSTNYLTPDQNGTSIPLYVYATVTGTNPVTTVPGTPQAVQISTGNFDGLQYVYYNVLATGGNAGGVTGGFNSSNGAVLNSTLGFNSSTNDASGNASAGVASQVGSINLGLGSTLGNASAGSTVAIGASSAWNVNAPAGSAVSSSAMTQFAKPRAGAPVWSNYASYNSSTGYTYLNDGTNVVIGNGSNGLATNQVAFLVETLSYTPSAFNASSPGALTSVNFSVQTPFNSGGGSILNNTSYAASNSFNDSSQAYTSYNSSSGSSISALTSSNYSSGHTVTLTDTLPGDANGDGTVGTADLSVVIHFFNSAQTAWANGNFDGSGTIDTGDLSDVIHFFNASLGSLPAEMAAPASLLDDPQAVALLESIGVTPVAAVPEPTSIAFLGLGAAAVLGRRRSRSTK